MSAAPVVIGVGSRACADDAIGLRLVEALRARGGAPRVALWEDNDALDVASGLLELDAPAVLVDCADMGLPPGSWRAFDAEDARLAEAEAAASTHGFGLADALALARALGYAHPVRVFGVQPFEVRPGRPHLSPPMQARVAPLTAALREELRRGRPLSPPGAR